jgi:hypothetical protein
MRMLHRFSLFFLVLLAACTIPQRQTHAGTHLAASPIAELATSISPTVAVTMNPNATKLPLATGTPPPPVKNISGNPPSEPTPHWLVNVQELEGVTIYNSPRWLGNDLISSFDYDTGYQFYQLNVLNNLPPKLLPTPASFLSVNPNDLVLSPTGIYGVVCKGWDDKQSVYTGLELYHVADHRLVSRTSPMQVGKPCSWSINWASDESMSTFVSEQAHPQDQLMGMEIYLWRTNGWAPTLLGKGTFSNAPGVFSPDLTRLAVQVQNSKSDTPDGFDTYKILYLDGRPARITGGQTFFHGFPEVTWLTNNIILYEDSHSAGCTFREYYAAETGDRLDDLFQADCHTVGKLGLGEESLSPDGRWLAADVTRQDFLEPSKPFNFVYLLYNLVTHEKISLSESPGVFIGFVGWNQTGDTFYLVRRPVNDQVVEQAGAPFGLQAIDLKTRQIQVIVPQLRFAWLSPDGENIVGLTGRKDGGRLGIYRLDGNVIPLDIKIANSQSIKIETIPQVQNIQDAPFIKGPLTVVWSHNGKVAAISDGSSLWLVRRESNFVLAAAGLEDTDFFIRDWSPDDTHLMVASKYHAWVVNVTSALPYSIKK